MRNGVEGQVGLWRLQVMTVEVQSEQTSFMMELPRPYDTLHPCGNSEIRYGYYDQPDRQRNTHDMMAIK
ncbi:hypothetical protein COCC4DRAFT_32696 [Bipolaris maydis ATCC 48331]|uniref:Uncharacterized protein n=2 Tax=Cochliobolus heterostrophus TaxID=5016 RepID=M2SP47_COCH5|nr:uncharacterized protein COCC4DRAFT_32696 [Bipolaris maydis ATCC 48331]EMD87105.1 hypothetical protein COCHEDRAFT_1023802 [Bipolaris maydis C5]ENI03902.1 hypothetical protein COCC4DRAFT_32696 [Bipolaris maydis ATCC 48331]